MADLTAQGLGSSLDRTTKISIHAKPRKSDGTFDKSVEIGVIQALSPSESRDVSAHWTLGGTDPEEPKVLIPGLVTGRSLSVKALALWKNSILNQLGYTTDAFMYSLSQQKYPFDIQVTKQKAGDATQCYTLTYTDCYANNFNYDQDISRAGDVVIVENITITYRTVTSA
jgi:hypothetical protein